MPLIYRDTIRLTAIECEHLQGIEEFITGIGYISSVTIHPERTTSDGQVFEREAIINFEFGAFSDESDDLWTIHDRAREIEDDLRCRDIHWQAERTAVKRVRSIPWALPA